jgi:hypothetical protein
MNQKQEGKKSIERKAKSKIGAVEIRLRFRFRGKREEQNPQNSPKSQNPLIKTSQGRKEETKNEQENSPEHAHTH